MMNNKQYASHYLIIKTALIFNPLAVDAESDGWVSGWVGGWLHVRDRGGAAGLTCKWRIWITFKTHGSDHLVAGGYRGDSCLL